MTPFKNALHTCFNNSPPRPHHSENLLSTKFHHILSFSVRHPPTRQPFTPSEHPIHTSPHPTNPPCNHAPTYSRPITRRFARLQRQRLQQLHHQQLHHHPPQPHPQPQPHQHPKYLPQNNPASFDTPAALQHNVSVAPPCMTGAITGKRKSSFPVPGETGPISSCHVHTFAPLKRPRKEKMVRLLDLSEDILVNIMTHVMTPAKEGTRRIVTEESIRASLPLATTCHTLYDIWRHSMHDLELWVSGKLNDRGLKAICKGNGRGIHRLGLRRCRNISPRAFQSIPRHCTRLRSIDMSLTEITDEFIIELTKNTGRTLQFLALHGCSKLTVRSIHAIADRCPHLRFLDVGAIPAVDDECVEYLVRKLGTSIRTMVLSECKNLSDSAMAVIGAECKALMSLTIRGLSTITDDGLHKLCSGIGERVQILDVLDCTGLTMGGYFATMEAYCPHVFRYLEESNYVDHLGERCLRDNIIATMPGLIYRISATDAIRRLPALYFLLLDESTLRPFRVSVQSKSLNLSDFGTVLISNFGKKPTPKTKSVLLSRFGYDSPFDSESDDESCDRV